MQWTKFSEAMPEAHRPILVAYTDEGEDSPKGVLFEWAHVALGHIVQFGFGHAFVNDAGDQIGGWTHDRMRKTGRWIYLYDLHAAIFAGHDCPLIVHGEPEIEGKPYFINV